MIYTIILNPALGRTLYVKKMKYDDSSRIEKEQRHAGGKPEGTGHNDDQRQLASMCKSANIPQDN